MAEVLESISTIGPTLMPPLHQGILTSEWDVIMLALHRRQILVILVLFVAWSCEERGDPLASGDSQVKERSPLQGAVDYSPEDMDRPISCIGEVRDTARLSLTAVLKPALLKDDEMAPVWSPGRVADIKPFSGRLVTVDAMNAELGILSVPLELTGMLGRRGEGPGEFEEPVAASVGPRGETLWIWDRGLRRIQAFDQEWNLTREFTVRGNFSDIAVGYDNRLYFGKNVFPFQVQEGIRDSSVAIAVASLSGDSAQSVISVRGDDLTFPRYNKIGHVLVRVRAGPSRLLVFYPYSGVVDLYRYGSSKPDTSIRTCVPERLDELYREQMAAVDTSEPFVESGIVFVSDVVQDPTGVVHVLNPAPTPDGVHHIDHFTPRGKNLGATLLMPDSSRLVRRSHFADREGEIIVSYDEDGVIRRYDIVAGGVN